MNADYPEALFLGYLRRLLLILVIFSNLYNLLVMCQMEWIKKGQHTPSWKFCPSVVALMTPARIHQSPNLSGVSPSVLRSWE